MKRGAGLTLAVGVVATIASASALAGPPTITETFDSSNDGWHVYEGLDESQAAWVASGGNPGGFIRYSDADGSGYDAFFGDEDYIEGIRRYRGAGSIVADVRSSVSNAKPRVYLGDASDYRAPRLHSDSGQSLGTEWSHFVFPLRARLWRDEDGDRVSPARFGRFLAEDPVILWDAEYSSAAGETTDLDNVGIFSGERELTIKYSKKFKGKIVPDNSSCAVGTVKVFRKRSGKDERIGKDDTDGQGRYVVKKNAKQGRYYAKIQEQEIEPGLVCEDAESPTIKVG